MAITKRVAAIKADEEAGYPSDDDAAIGPVTEEVVDEEQSDDDDTAGEATQTWTAEVALPSSRDNGDHKSIELEEKNDIEMADAAADLDKM